MKSLIGFSLSLLLALSLVGCVSGGGNNGGDEDTASSDLGSSVDTVSDGETPDAPACTIEPTLASLSENYFSKSCNFGSCHGSTKAGGLDLTGDAHAALVNVPAVFAGAADNGKILVIPGDPDNSYFVQKLEGPDASEGAIMPFGAQEPMDPDCRIKMVRQWIADGANP